MPILHCEIGNHDWSRESQRGRKPRNCPDHQPEKDIKITSGAKSVRFDSISDEDHGNQMFDKHLSHIEKQDQAKTHEYEFSEDTAKLLNEMMRATGTRILRCEHGEGHDWEAPSKRGRPPRFCPEHLAVATQKPAQRESNTKTQEILLTAILEKPGAAQCKCGIGIETSPAQLRAKGGGCRDPHHVCNVLDACRRAVGI